MLGVLEGFAIIGAIILLGYIVGRSRVLGGQAQFVLSRASFYVFSPFLLFAVLSKSDVHVLFSALLPVSFIAAVVSAGLFALIARFVLHRPVPETVIGSLSSSYVNGNNIGIPIGVYVLGNAAYSAPVVLLQLLVFVPVALGILDVHARGRASLRRILLQPVTNPIIIGSALGVLVAVTGVHLPAVVFDPIQLIAGAAVPTMLITFGMSLNGERPLASGSSRADIIIAAALKLVAMPVVAYLVGSLLFHLHREQLFVVVVLAALPTAQNVFNYAQVYSTGEILARDVILISTTLCVPVLLLAAALLA